MLTSCVSAGRPLDVAVGRYNLGGGRLNGSTSDLNRKLGNPLPPPPSPEEASTVIGCAASGSKLAVTRASNSGLRNKNLPPKAAD